MRSVVRLRTRPGRPWWQLTTRPSTSAVLALVSFAAAGVQAALFSSPTPWYQVAVVVFWVVVGVAFVASALGSRALARRRAATPVRPPVDPAPFVPVPVRPARPRSRVESGAEVGEPTDPVETPRTTAVARPAPARASARAARPSPVRRSAQEEPTATVSRERIASAPRPAQSWRPSRAAEERTTTVAVTSRHAVRAVAAVESASRPVAVPAEAVAAADRRGAARRGMTAETVAIRDGRVRPRPSASTETATGRPGGGRRRLAEEPPPAAPVDAVPSPRPALSVEQPRPTPGRRAEEPTVRRSSHARRTAAQEREGHAKQDSGPSRVPDVPLGAREPAARERHTRQDSGPSRMPDVPLAGRARGEREQPTRERHTRQDPGPSRMPDVPLAAERAQRAERAERPAPTRRREGPPASTEKTAPFGGSLTFGAGAVPAEPAPEAWAPAPRGPVPEPSSGRHAALVAPSGSDGEDVPNRAARHAVPAASGRRRAS